MRTRDELLAEINRELPAGVDWKGGAETYLRELVARGGEAFRRWHLTKPFLGEPLAGATLHGDDARPAVDPHVTHHEMQGLLNVVLAAGLAPGARVLDVGCGPGWTAHYLGKMGYSVLGFDISEDLLAIARERVAREPFPPYPMERLDVRFLRHDVEAAPPPPGAGGPFDFALLDSVLHHFHDPVAALENVARSLRPGALVAIVESLRAEGAPLEPHTVEIMRRYRTLERPYTASQMADLLRLAGFQHHVELRGVNGLFTEEELARPLLPGPLGAILASRDAAPLARWAAGGGLRYLGFHEEEHDARGSFRWALPQCALVLDGRDLALTLASHAGGLGHERHDVFVSVADEPARTLCFAPGQAEATVRPGPRPAGTRVSFHSSFSFCPKLVGMSADPRVLAFQLRVGPA